MKLNANDFRVQSGKKVKLSEWATTLDHFVLTGSEYRDVPAKHVAELSSLQQLHYASHRYALLLASTWQRRDSQPPHSSGQRGKRERSVPH